MPLSAEDTEFFKSILPGDSIVTGSSPDYPRHTKPWSLSYDLEPSLVLVPDNVQQVQNIVKYCYDSNAIDFAVRGSGIGNASATDVVISMKKFNELTVADEGRGKVVYVGAGLSWGDVDERLAKVAPGYVVVGARCPYVGVTGSTLMGGLSWLSHELGLGSDPKNMLDAFIVLADGRAIWASEEPDLLWALRGGGGNFGVVTQLCLRAHPSEQTIFAGMIFLPDSSLPALSKGLAAWAHSPDGHDPRTALHLFVFDFTQKTLHGVKTEPQLVALIFDGRGEAHARSDKGFKWALELDGAREESMRQMELRDVHELQRSTEGTHGTVRSWLQAALIEDEDINDDEGAGIVGRMCRWYEDVKNNTPELGLGTFALLEIMQEPAFSSAGSAAATAWPRGDKGRLHVLQLGVGGAPGKESDGAIAVEKLEDMAMRVLSEAPAKITNRKSHPPANFLPNFLLKHNDMSAVFGVNWKKLRSLKGLYDPNGRFKKGFFIPPA